MPVSILSTHTLHSPRDRILDTAAELFALRGFQAVGLRDLASYLGLHAGSLYHHFDNKQALLFELIESGLLNLLQQTKQQMQGKKRRPCERLDLLIRAFVKFNACEKHRLTLLTREFANLNQEQQARIIQLKNNYTALLSTVLADGRNEEEQPDGVVCPLAHTAIIILFGQSHWYTPETTEPQLTTSLTNTFKCLMDSRKSA